MASRRTTGLLTFELNTHVSQDPLLDAVYCGTLPRDWFRQQLNTEDTHFPKAYVVNTDDSRQPGQHWVSFYRPTPGVVEYFDSYGLPPHYLNFQSELDRMGWCYQEVNTICLQSEDSTVCGLYCLYYLTHRVRG